MIQEINQNFKSELKHFSNHPIHHHINTKRQLQRYLEHQVFAVWANMSLLNYLKEEFTKTTNPWLPIGDPELRFLINKTILQEETAKNYFGAHQSEFEIYLDAMAATGANTENITNFLRHVSHGTDIFLIIAASKLPLCIKQFIKTVFDIISEDKPHKIAAAFVYSKEGMGDPILIKTISKIEEVEKADLKLFKYYLRLQAEKDSDPSFKILEMLCGEDMDKWRDTEIIAEIILRNQRTLMEGIEAELTGSISE
ncbi:DUF3050 domain-containing protein [Salegentibacter flavus]|uniref:DUF3050 domain-containing protein n=1 Tax=Salegentibacter flavus TaxID=287099 RepID=A0A1I5AQE5_9FLAO|nr:DUF3050 domain-containing protein [Salegentibacter flavus]SFN64657.1 Protein of unknown function [Salegentibacter flavus]